MTDPPPTASPRPEPLVRGFLFADLRGYTAFVERAGDAAAAELLERYRGLVRGVVAEQAGAEIRTEGDSFYVVFPSPSAAVRAGLALVERAAADATDHPSDPIVVGVGIHAGESAETGEGYVGSAVNLAARICSVARSGEVLVSATVRSLARTSLPVSYASRGRPALKGVSEPVELFAVTPATGAPGIPAPSASRLAPPASTRARAGLVGLGAGVVVLAVVGIAALSGGPGGSGGPSPSPSGAAASGGPSPSTGAPSPSGPAAFKTGPLEAGTYRTSVFTPGIELTVPDGWMGLLEIPNMVVLGLADDPVREVSPGGNYEFGGRLSILRPKVAASPCTPLTPPMDPRPSGFTTVEVPPGRTGLTAWAATTGSVVLGPPASTRLGAFDTTGYEVTMPQACAGTGSGAFEVFSIADAGWRARYIKFARDATDWYVSEITGETMLVAIDSPASLPDFEDAARSVLTSLKPAA
jgi:class 3 adenylate cyclase